MEEIEAAKAFVQSGQRVDTLDDASKWIILMHDVPALRPRLDLHFFRMTFAERLEQNMEMLAKVKGALVQVHKSTNFAALMMLVLKTGNQLNAGTATGGAIGFRMESLSTLP